MFSRCVNESDVLSVEEFDAQPRRRQMVVTHPVVAADKVFGFQARKEGRHVTLVTGDDLISEPSQSPLTFKIGENRFPFRPGEQSVRTETHGHTSEPFSLAEKVDVTPMENVEGT